MSALWRVLVQNAAGNRGTPIDWCEANYAVSPHVAEFYNTASSACYVVAGSETALHFITADDSADEKELG